MQLSRRTVIFLAATVLTLGLWLARPRGETGRRRPPLTRSALAWQEATLLKVEDPHEPITVVTVEGRRGLVLEGITIVQGAGGPVSLVIVDEPGRVLARGIASPRWSFRALAIDGRMRVQVTGGRAPEGLQIRYRLRVMRRSRPSPTSRAR